MSAITKEFTKEQLQQIIETDHVQCGEASSLARIALASLEADPVAWLLSGGGAKNNVSFDSGNAYVDPMREVTPLYTAPPAPVSVPDEVLKRLLPDAEKAEFWFEHDGKILFEGVKFNNAVFEACRAAMLQGAEPVTTDYKLPFDQWLSQQTGTIDVECGCVMTEVFFHWLRVAYEAGNSPVIADGWVLVPEEPTHEMLEAGDEQFGTYDVYRRMIEAAPKLE